MNTVERVALVIHPTDLETYRRNIRLARPDYEYRDELLIRFMEWADPVKVKDYESFTLGDRTVGGSLILVPFLPEMRDSAIEKVVGKVDQGLSLAKEEGCTVAAMGGFTSIVIQGREEELCQKHGIRITSGNTLTAALIIKSIEELSQRFGFDLENQTIAIIGASGDIGNGCYLYFAEKVPKLILTARGLASLQASVDKTAGMFDCEIVVTDDNEMAVATSTIAIFVTSSARSLFSLSQLPSGIVVCDASAPQNITIDCELRPDVFLYHGGVAQLPFEVDAGFDTGLPSPSLLFGCQTEGILNAMYPDLPLSVGRGNILPSKIKRFRRLLDSEPGIGVAYSIRNRVYSEQDLVSYSHRLKEGR